MDTPRPSPRTNRTRPVPHPVLIGHAASLSQASIRQREHIFFAAERGAAVQPAAAAAALEGGQKLCRFVYDGAKDSLHTLDEQRLHKDLRRDIVEMLARAPPAEANARRAARRAERDAARAERDAARAADKAQREARREAARAARAADKARRLAEKQARARARAAARGVGADEEGEHPPPLPTSFSPY